MESFVDEEVVEYRSALDVGVSHDAIREMGRQGLSVASIAKQTGVLKYSIETVLVAAGIKLNDKTLRRPPTSPHRFNHTAAVAAVRAGESYASVARRMGVTAGSVAYVVKRAGPAS